MITATKIHLVLITAALASCNRVIIPADLTAGYTTDLTLARTPADTSCLCYCSAFKFNPTLSFPGESYRRGAFWRNHQFILRGGFGKSNFSTAS